MKVSVFNIYIIILLCTFIGFTPVYCQKKPTGKAVEARKDSKDPQWISYPVTTVGDLPGFRKRKEPATSVYGGWKVWKKEATGFFRTEKIDGRWWIIDPEGYPFIHKAVVAFNPGKSPKQLDAFKKKYQDNAKWADVETNMLSAYGFNGTGAWTNVDVVRAQQKPLAYTVIVSPMGTYKRDHQKKYGGKYEQAGWQGYRFDLVMVFDKEFDEYVAKAIEPVAKYKDDKHLLGYFTDNELPWVYDALDRHLTLLAKDEQGHLAARQWLENRKGKGATVAGITDEDRSAFTAFYFETYMKKVTAALRKADPNHLYLGCRFNQDKNKQELTNPDIFRVAGKYMDVISINHYRKWEPDEERLRNWGEWSGKPFLITEWYTKAEDSGLPNNTGAGWLVHTQKDRGLFYQNFTLGLLQSKYCVGWHWFKYMDNDPDDLTTDPSNRDSNKGIVDRYFNSYTPLLEEMKQININTYHLIQYFDKKKEETKKNAGIYKKGWIDFNKNGVKDIFEDTSAPIDKRVADLLSQMTMDEKTCQLATLYGSGRVLKDSAPTAEWKNEIWKDGIANIDEQANGIGKFGSEISFPYAKSIENRQTIQRWFVEETRLGIPVDFTNEGIRGLCHDRATLFPAQCGQGATWNRELIRAIADVTAKEAVALGYTNIYSPILDLSRDPRWGRVVECYSEDPYLTGELGKQMIQRLQSYGLVSTPKHFAVYSVPVGGRDEGTRTDPHVAPREMKTLYLEPFRKAFQEAEALGVMSSYNDYDGEPISGSYHFLTEVLRQQWGFKGYVVSDSEAVEFLHTKHKVAPTTEDMAAQVVNAGLNVRTHFTMPQAFILPLRQAIASGKVSQHTIDQRVSEVLRVKFMLGLFDNPYKGDTQTVNKVVHSKEHQELSLRAALESMVLLKNEGNLLPLSNELKQIAVIGPNADETDNLICRYGPANAPIKSVYQGIREYLPQAKVSYAKGCNIIDKYFPESELYDVPLDVEEQRMIDEAVALARSSDVAIVVLGGNEKTVREEYSRSDLNLTGRQETLLKEIHKTGKPVVLLLIDGRAATINWAANYIPAIVHGWFPGEFTGNAVAQVLFGDYNPGGKLAVTFPKSVGQIPYAFPFKPGADSKGKVRVDGALYPFGYGLSYTTFAYNNLVIKTPRIGSQQDIEITCKIKNTGDRAGDEIVQLYINDEYSSLTTYEKVLRGFERVHLEPGEEKELSFTLTPKHLGLWNRHDEFVVEAGTFKVMVGSSSEDIRLEGSFEVLKE